MYRCDTWDDHYYRTPDDMAALTTRYDDYNRSWPPVFVGEFAANGAGAKPNLRAAVAESTNTNTNANTNTSASTNTNIILSVQARGGGGEHVHARL